MKVWSTTIAMYMYGVHVHVYMLDYTDNLNTYMLFANWVCLR